MFLTCDLNPINFYYSCGLSTATIEYSSLSVCLCVCMSVCLSVCVHDNSKNNGSIDLKLEHIVVYENSLGIVQSRSRSRHEIFLHLPQYKL